MTTDEEWKNGSPVFLSDSTGKKKEAAPNGNFILADSSALEISSGKVTSISKKSGTETEMQTVLVPSDYFNIKKSLGSANYWWLGLSILIGVLSNVIRAYRWGMLLEPMGYKPKFLNSFFAVIIGYLVNYGVPRLGEVTRCTVMDRYEKIPFTKAFGTVVAERVLDMIFFLILFFVMLFSQYTKISGYLNENTFPAIKNKWNALLHNTTWLVIASVGLLLLILFLFYFRKKIKGKVAEKLNGIIKGFAEGLRAVGKVKSPVYFVFLTAMIWVCYYVMFHVCFNCLAGTSSLGFSEGITGFVFGTFTVMITPGGIGAYPLAMREILNKVYFLPVTLGFSLGWLSWIASFLSVVSFGLIALLFLPIYNNKKNDPTS